MGALDGEGADCFFVVLKFVGGFAGDGVYAVGIFEAGPFLGEFDGLLVGNSFCAQAGFEDAGFADGHGEGSGIDAGDAWDVVLAEIFVEVELAAPVAGDWAEFADYEAGSLGAGGLFVGWVNAVVADLGGGEGDDLAEVGGIGKDFLVAGHACVENGFPQDGFGGAEGGSPEDAAVFEC